jgi:hypothetical protein
MDIKVTFDKEALSNYSSLISNPIVKEFLNEFILLVNSEINLTSLKEIIFSKNYSETLLNFQRDNNLTEGYTNNGVLTGVAKTESVITNGEVGHYVFFHFAILLNILIDDDSKEHEGTKNICLNTMFHEFCHVHDDILLESIGHATFRSDNHLDNVLYQIALSLWSEYFAHRKSMGIFAIPIDFSSLKNDLLELEGIIRNENPINIVEIYQSVHSYIQYLVRQIGNAHGSDTPEFEESHCIEDTIIGNYINELSTTLDALYNNYPKWDNLKEIENLKKLIRRVWEDLGFVITEIENEFFLDYT